jgi:hypothetical protein
VHDTDRTALVRLHLKGFDEILRSCLVRYAREYCAQRMACIWMLSRSSMAVGGVGYFFFGNNSVHFALPGPIRANHRIAGVS